MGTRGGEGSDRCFGAFVPLSPGAATSSHTLTLPSAAGASHAAWGCALQDGEGEQLVFHVFLYPKSSSTSPGVGSGSPHTIPKQAQERFEMLGHGTGLWVALTAAGKMPAPGSAKHHCAPEAKQKKTISSLSPSILCRVPHEPKLLWVVLWIWKVLGTLGFSQWVGSVWVCRPIQNYLFCGQSVSKKKKKVLAVFLYQKSPWSTEIPWGRHLISPSQDFHPDGLIRSVQVCRNIWFSGWLSGGK